MGDCQEVKFCIQWKVVIASHSNDESHPVFKLHKT